MLLLLTVNNMFPNRVSVVYGLGKGAGSPPPTIYLLIMSLVLLSVAVTIILGGLGGFRLS